MSTFLTEITCVWGCRGSGKTTLAKDMVAKAKPKQLVIIDPLSQSGVGAQGVIDAIERGDKVVVCNAQTKEDQLGAVLAAYALSTPDKPVYALCDEAPAYMDQTTPALNKIMFQGRHASFGMCLIGQRPAAVAAQIRSQAAATYWMRLADHVDISTAAKSLGTDRASDLQNLKTGEFVKHPD